MTNHTRKLLSLALGCSLGICFTSQVSAATFNVSTSGNGTITLTSADDNLSITGTGGEISYSVGDESGILSGVRRLRIVARGGDNVISLEQLQLEQDLTIRVAGGADDISVTDSDIGRRLSIVTAGGADNIELDNVTVEGRVTVVTSAGSDTVNLNGNTFNNVLSVNTGANDDELTATGNLGSLRTMLNGSGGRGDVYRQDENNVFGSPFVFRGFETEEIVETETIYAIGDTGPGGGFVFYVDPDSDGTSGLEAAPEDFPTLQRWCDSGAVTPAIGTAIGTGATNTSAILESGLCPFNAAFVATVYEVDGIDDWFLPSKDELNTMYETVGPGSPICITNPESSECNVAGFTNDGVDSGNGNYWSSSEFVVISNGAWAQNFLPNGNQFAADKFTLLNVRPVRAF